MSSTQASTFSSVPFSVTHPQQNVRLLELPPELLEFLTSDAKPSQLSLKVAPSTADTEDGDRSSKAREGHLHLCTETEVYTVRQVSTSNSLYVLAPTTGSKAASRGVTAISQPTSTLEVIPKAHTQEEVVAAILENVPVYDVPADPKAAPPDAAPTTTTRKSMLRSDLFLALPFPDQAIRNALKSLLLISERGDVELEDSYAPVALPTASLLLFSWKQFRKRCADAQLSLPALRLDAPEIQSMVKRKAPAEPWNDADLDIHDQEQYHPLVCSCIHAIFRKFQSAPNRPLKPRETSVFLGELLLRSKAPASPPRSKHKLTTTSPTTRLDDDTHPNTATIPQTRFLNQWLDLLPTEWTDHCALHHLNPTFYAVSSSSAADDDAGHEPVVWWTGPANLTNAGGRQLHHHAEANEGGAGATTATATAASKKKLGKWHERFARDRR